MRARSLAIVGVLIAPAALGATELDRTRAAEKAAVRSFSHPYAGFWKAGACADPFGLAIAPADGSRYSVSFCGPGGCFPQGTYRPNTTLVGDPNYRIIDNNTIELRTAEGYSKYVRCKQR